MSVNPPATTQRVLWQWLLCFLITLPATLYAAPQGHALDFDGVDDSVEIFLGSSRPRIGYTFGAWVYLRSGSSWDGKRTAVLSSPGCGGGVELLIRANTGNPNDPQFLEFGQCGAFNGVPSTLPVPLRTWTHVAVTVASDHKVSYFINGQLAGSHYPTLPGPDSHSLGETIRLGNNNEFRSFDGRLDEVLILSQALDPATLSSSFNTNFKGSEFPFLHAVFSFNEGTGGQLLDGAPAGGLTPGKLLGGPVWVRSGPMPPAAIRYEGTQQDFGGGWRTAASSKSRDIDGDQVFGTDGHQFVNRAPAKPFYLTSMEAVTGSYPGNEEYAFIDDPENPGETFMTGTQNPAPGPGLSADVFRFTLNAHAVGRLIRVGVMIDHLDNAAYNPASLRLVQVTGGGAGPAPVATTSALYRNRKPDWLFFDISGGQTGDTFVLRGAGGPNGEATVGGVSFDSLGPVGGRIRLVQGTTPSPYPSRIHVSGMGADVGKLTLTLNGIRTGSPGLGLLLVGPGGQKLRPMVSAGAGFNAKDGATLTLDDFALDELPTPLEGTIPSGTYRPQADQGLAGDLPAPAPTGPYSSGLTKAFDGTLNGVWSLYVTGVSGLIESWSLNFITAPPPTVSDLGASEVRYETARLHGMVDPEGLPTAVWFELLQGQGPGRTITLTPQVHLVRGQFEPVAISTPLSGLTPGQAYQFYMVASNAAAIRSTPMQSFQTGTSQVSNLGDDGPGSLRAAIDHAPAGTIIDLRGLSGVVALRKGPLIVQRSVTLLGPGANTLAISGRYVQSLLENQSTLSISGLTLREGLSKAMNGDGTFAPIVNKGNLSLTECAVVQNVTTGLSFGAILNYRPGRLELHRCTLSGNTSLNGSGGALNNQFGSVLLRQCTLADNSAVTAAAIYTLAGLVDLVECTVSRNAAHTWGAIEVRTTSPGAALRLQNSLVAGNQVGTGPDIDGHVSDGHVVSNGSNLIGIWDPAQPLVNASGHPDRLGNPASPLNARLSPLADNGGPTLTMALQPDSPAIDVGRTVTEPGVDGWDQRGQGFARRSGFGVDIGAYEFQAPDPVTPVIRIDVPPPGAVDGLYLSWPSTLVGGQPVAWPLLRQNSLDPTVPWSRVEPSKVTWNPATGRWHFTTSKDSGAEFFWLGNPGP